MAANGKIAQFLLENSRRPVLGEFYHRFIAVSLNSALGAEKKKMKQLAERRKKKKKVEMICQ